MAKRAIKVSDPAKRVTIEYIKSQSFRVIHADGAIGGVTPSGNVHLALYSERAAIPRTLVHEANDDGSLGNPIPEETIVRPGLIREMDVDVILTRPAVEGLLKWLTDRMKDLEERDKIQKKIESSRKRSRK